MLPLDWADYTAFLIATLGLIVLILELRSYRQNCGWPWRWIYLFKGISGLYMTIIFMIAVFNGWGIDGRVAALPGRVGAIFILTALALGAIVNNKRSDC